jgi:hypothetical protein
MKKLMSLMLGLTLLVGTTVLFGDDAPPKKEGKKVAPASTKTSKGKKSGKKGKKTDTTSTEKKS